MHTVAAVSGAHINPAVTVALAVVRRFPRRQMPVYVSAQWAEAVLAAWVNRFLFGPTAGAVAGAALRRSHWAEAAEKRWKASADKDGDHP